MTDTLRIVSVEDQQVDAELVADALAAAGLAVRLERVDDEAGFLQAIETAWPDAILVDWTLPRFSGRRALEIARERCPEVPCIVVSGTIQDAMVIEALRLGAADCIHKNQLELLAPALERALEHARRQRVIHEQETMLREMSAMAHIGAWRFDPATGRGAWTEEVERIFEVAPGTEPSVAFALDFFHSPSREQIEAAIHEASESGKPFDLELEMVTARGNRKWVRTMGIPVLQEGRVVEVRGTVQDITERKEAEEALRDSEEKFRRMAAAAQDAIVMIDDQGRIVSWNEAAERIFGFPEEQVLGKLLHELIVPERFLAQVVAGLARFSQSGEGPVLGHSGELPALRSDGTEFLAEHSISATQIGSKWHAIGIVRDITERKEAQRLLEEQLDELRRFQKVAVGRELRMQEVVEENRRLKVQLEKLQGGG